MLTEYSLLNFAVGLLLFCFSFSLHEVSTNRAGRVYAHYSFLTGIWALVTGIFIFIPKEDSYLVLFAIRLLYWIALAIPLCFFYFSLVYRSDLRTYTGWKWGGAVYLAASLPLYLFTDLVVRSISFGATALERIPEYSPFGFILFNIVFVVFAVAAFVQLYKKWKRTEEPEARQRAQYLFWASTITFIPGAVMGLLFPIFNTLGYFDPPLRLYWLSPLVGGIRTFIITYGIFRLRLFDLRLFWVQFLAIILMSILFFNIFIGH